MAKKKIDPAYAVTDQDPFVKPKFKSHNNENPIAYATDEQGGVKQIPPDPFCAVKIKGYVDTGSGYRGYEVQAKRYERENMVNWVRGKSWETVGYILPFTFQVTWLTRSNWLSDMVGVLIKDIQEYEAVWRERLKKGV